MALDKDVTKGNFTIFYKHTQLGLGNMGKKSYHDIFIYRYISQYKNKSLGVVIGGRLPLVPGCVCKSLHSQCSKRVALLLVMKKISGIPCLCRNICST